MTNAVAKRDFKATCGHVVPAGSRCRIYRERALSYREAMHAGTMYPKRSKCASCAEAR